MRALAWHGLLLLVSGWISWWVFLRVPPAPASPGEREPAAVLNVLPLVHESAASAPEASLASADPAAPPARTEPEAVPVPVPVPVPAPDETIVAIENDELELAQAPDLPAPAASELGTPEGRDDEAGLPPEAALEEEPAPPVPAEQAGEPVPSVLELPDAPPPEPEAPGNGTSPAPREQPPASAPAEEPAKPRVARDAVEAVMRDPTLVALAREEFSAGNRRGFTTVLLAAPEEQIEIARFFGEELVLVPRAALDPANPEPAYFRLAERGAPAVERVGGAPRLEDHRQYRDLFDYEYARLPAPLRELRRSLVARGDVYLFAALLSAEEWALVIARRREALERAGRELADVRRFVLRYARLAGGGFDLRAEEIVFADGSRFVPGLPGKGDG